MYDSKTTDFRNAFTDLLRLEKMYAPALHACFVEQV